MDQTFALLRLKRLTLLYSLFQLLHVCKLGQLVFEFFAIESLVLFLPQINRPKLLRWLRLLLRELLGLRRLAVLAAAFGSLHFTIAPRLRPFHRSSQLLTNASLSLLFNNFRLFS